MFNQEELKNILALIGQATITGKEALVVALLQQKIQNLLKPEEEKKEEKKGRKTE